MIKTLASVTLLLCPLFCLAAERVDVNPYGKYLSDSMGLIEVEMATVKNKNTSDIHDVIVRLSGLLAYQHDLDGKTLLLRASQAGKGTNFSYTRNDKDYALITSRSAWDSWESMQIHLGGASFDIFVNESQSQMVKPEHLVTALMNGPQESDWEYAVNPYGLYFTSSPAGLEIELAYFKQINKAGLHDIIMKISGAEAFNEGIDGKIIKYSATKAGTGVNYSTEENGKIVNRLTTRSSWWSWTSYELYVGKKKFHLVLHVDESRNVRPAHLLTAFEQGNQEPI